VFFDGFGTLLWIWALLGGRRAAGGVPRRQMTRKRHPNAQKWVPFWLTFAGGRHHFPNCFSMCFSCSLFIATCTFWGDFRKCFGRHLVSLGPLKIMPKCTTIRSFRVWTLLVRSLFPDLVLVRGWHAFCEIRVPIGAPIGAPFGYFCQLLQGLILEAVLGRQKGVKSLRNALAGGSGGAC
jgi:hypothetical protein